MYEFMFFVQVTKTDNSFFNVCKYGKGKDFTDAWNKTKSNWIKKGYSVQCIEHKLVGRSYK